MKARTRAIIEAALAIEEKDPIDLIGGILVLCGWQLGQVTEDQACHVLKANAVDLVNTFYALAQSGAAVCRSETRPD